MLLQKSMPRYGQYLRNLDLPQRKCARDAWRISMADYI
jgi:hypothetical protein